MAILRCKMVGYCVLSEQKLPGSGRQDHYKGRTSVLIEGEARLGAVSLS